MNASTSLPTAGREHDDALNALFAAPRIRTDGRGVHTDDRGRRYDAVTVNGELTYRLAGVASTGHRFAPADSGVRFVADAAQDSDQVEVVYVAAPVEVDAADVGGGWGS